MFNITAGLFLGALAMVSAGNSADRAERTRKLLNTWRKDVGLPRLK